MTSVFTDFFRAQLFANTGLMAGKQIEIYYFTQHASFTDPNDSRYTTLQTLTDLQGVLGWGTPSTPTVAHTVSTTDVGSSRYVIDGASHLNAPGWLDTTVVAAAVVLKGGPYGGVSNPLIFVTDSPFGGGTVMRQNDALVALPAANVSNLAWFFGWQMPPVGATQVLPTVGTLSVLKAPPEYEYSHQQHVWLFPQRVNLLANPSFEAGTNHWKSNGTLSQAAGGAPGGGVWEGHLTGAGTAMKKGPFWLQPGAVVTTRNQPMDVPFVVKARVSLPTLGTTQFLAGHTAPGTNAWYLDFFASGLRLAVSYDGTSMDLSLPPVFTAAELDAVANPNEPFYIGVEVFSSVGLIAYQGITSTDGLTWTPAAPLKNFDAGVNSVYTSTAPYTVGAVGGGAKIYWCSLESEGTPLWRFDAASGYYEAHWRGPTGEDWEVGPKPLPGTPSTLIDGTPGTALVLESNMFPTNTEAVAAERWTIQAMIRGTGKVRIGLMSWESNFATTAVDWGPDTDIWTLPANGWLHVYALRRVGEGVSGVVRIECDGTDIRLDNLLVEPEWLSGWPYFDGDTTYGAMDDFSWYGGENRQHSTYSLWYNHRRAVVGRLFAWGIAEDDFTVTDEEIEAQGFVYKWVPAGVRVIPHMDVLSIGDPQAVIPPVTGAVMPGKSSYTDKTGVSPAWAVASP